MGEIKIFEIEESIHDTPATDTTEPPFFWQFQSKMQAEGVDDAPQPNDGVRSPQITFMETTSVHLHLLTLTKAQLLMFFPSFATTLAFHRATWFG